MTDDWGNLVQLPFLLYLLGYALANLLLNCAAFAFLTRHLREGMFNAGPDVFAGFEPPISLLVPAHNEAKGVSDSVASLLRLRYPDYEIIVINDGSTDETMETLRARFSLETFPEAYRQQIPTKKVRGIYRSPHHANLRVIDKENGGKADAMNAGINAARYPLICVVDADSILQPDSLRLVVRPFLEDPEVIAAGGTIRVVNGCEVTKGFFRKARLPRHPLALLQVIEYIRAFLFGRVGWSPLNGVLVLSGAFSLFRRRNLVRVGGFSRETLTEDMEIVIRLHKDCIARKEPYHIAFVPEPVCWTEVPEKLSTLRRQRLRWQQGLAECLWFYRKLPFSDCPRMIRWLAFPYQVLFEWWSPLILMGGYLIVITGALAGFLSLEAFRAFLLFEIGFGILLSITALFLEQISFRIYPRVGQTLALAGVGVLENLGYRQINAFWRLEGLFRWILNVKSKWGQMERKGISTPSSPQPAEAKGA